MKLAAHFLHVLVMALLISSCAHTGTESDENSSFIRLEKPFQHRGVNIIGWDLGRWQMQDNFSTVTLFLRDEGGDVEEVTLSPSKPQFEILIFKSIGHQVVTAEAADGSVAGIVFQLVTFSLTPKDPRPYLILESSGGHGIGRAYYSKIPNSMR